MKKRRILFWYIFKELMSPFFLGLLIFTFILLMNKILKLMDMVINKGVGITEVLSLISMLLPSLLVLTLPMSILLAVLICLGKLSSDSELTAIKASGVSLYQMLPPFVVLCVTGFILTSVLTLYLLPRSNLAFRRQLIETAKKHSEASLEEGVFNDSFKDMVVYVNRFNRRKNNIHGILISDKRDPDLPTIIVAKEANLFSLPGAGGILFELFDGSLHRLNRRKQSYQYVLFDQYRMKFQFEDEKAEDELKRKEMGLLFLINEAIRRKRAGVSAIRINVEINKRLAFPFACLVFGLLGVSLGCAWRKGGRSYGFILSIFIVFLYYMLLSVGENLAKSGYLLPFMGIWMPNVVMGTAGIHLFRKTAREQEPQFQWLSGFLDAATQKLATRRVKRRSG